MRVKRKSGSGTKKQVPDKGAFQLEAELKSADKGTLPGRSGTDNRKEESNEGKTGAD